MVLEWRIKKDISSQHGATTGSWGLRLSPYIKMTYALMIPLKHVIRQIRSHYFFMRSRKCQCMPHVLSHLSQWVLLTRGANNMYIGLMNATCGTLTKVWRAYVLPLFTVLLKSLVPFKPPHAICRKRSDPSKLPFCFRQILTQISFNILASGRGQYGSGRLLGSKSGRL